MTKPIKFVGSKQMFYPRNDEEIARSHGVKVIGQNYDQIVVESVSYFTRTKSQL